MSEFFDVSKLRETFPELPRPVKLPTNPWVRRLLSLSASVTDDTRPVRGLSSSETRQAAAKLRPTS